nr:hypothetical protein [Tanacetum cinerariifolium]
MDLFNLISASNPTKVEAGTRPRAAYEVPLLTATVSCVIDMEDTAVTSGSSRTPPALDKSPLDFANEDPPKIITERGGTKDQNSIVTELVFCCFIRLHLNTCSFVIIKSINPIEVAAIGSLVNKRRRKRGNNLAKANAPPKVLRKDHATFRPAQSTLRGKSLASIRLDARSTFSTPATHDAPTTAKSVSDPDLLSYVKPQLYPKLDIAQSSKKTTTGIPIGNVATTEVQGMFFAESPESGKSTPFPSMDGSPGGGYGSQLRLRFKQEVRLLKKDTTKIAKRDQRIQAREEEMKKLDQEIKSLRVVEAEVYGLHNQTKNLETLLEAEVSNLQAQVTGEEKIKAAFEEFKKYEDDKVEQRCAEMDARLDKLRIVKGMSEGLKHDIEHRKASRDLAVVEAYDPEADSKRFPQWICNLRHSSSQLKIPIYPKVCHPEDPWAFKEEILLEDAIVANISQVEKRRSAGWFVAPIRLVPLITPDPMASSYPCLPLLPGGWRFCWRMSPHRSKWLTKKMNHIQDYNDPSFCHLLIIRNGNSAACCT